MIGGDNKYLNPHTKYIAETYFYSNIFLTTELLELNRISLN